MGSAIVGIDRDRLEIALQQLPAFPFPLEIHTFDTVCSTNTMVWELVDRGRPPGTVVIATQQTAGKGQRGRQWRSPPGGLYLSIAIAPQILAENALLLTLSTAWGIATTFRQPPVTTDNPFPKIPVQLKWPNDLILKKRKLGGILTETRIRQGQITKAVVGVGINWSNPVPEIGINLKTFLASERLPSLPSLEMLAAITLQGIVSGYQYACQKGIASLLASYQQLLTSLGKLVVVDGYSGVITGVSNQGKLRVHLESKNAALGSEIHLEPSTIDLGYD